jgi:flagellar biosynthesis protein FlhB
MAEQQGAERTEQPTVRRLAKAREKGQVPQSQELMSFASIVILLATVTFLAPDLLRWFTEQVKAGLSCDTSAFANNEAFINFINTKIIDSTIIILPILLALCVGTIFCSIVIGGGFNYAPEALMPKLSALNPMKGLHNLVNSRAIVQLLLSITKFTFISIIAWVYLEKQLDTLATLRWAWSLEILTVTSKMILGLMIRICIALLIIGLIDVFYQKWKYIEGLKMTKQEVKEENKQTEGLPEVKHRIRKVQVEMAMKRMLQEVPKANVVLVNPTHVAVALRYDSKTMEAPVMVAKGADHMAEKIREIARAYGVPIIRRPELARAIYSTVKPGHPIPETLYVAVAEIMALIHRLRRRKL